MNKQIQSKSIGQLKQDIFPTWWKSNEIEIPYFDNQKIAFIFSDFEPQNDEKFIDEADQALANFLKLGVDERNSISELVYKNCLHFFEITGLNKETIKMFQEIEDPIDWHKQVIHKGKLLDLKDINEVWQFVHPTEIHVVRRPYEEPDIYVQVYCNCDWEIEHGLQLVFKQGKKITRISQQDGHLTEADAYNIPDEEDELLSKF
jgi:hypothetical protein